MFRWFPGSTSKFTVIPFFALSSHDMFHASGFVLKGNCLEVYCVSRRRYISISKLVLEWKSTHISGGIFKYSHKTIGF